MNSEAMVLAARQLWLLGDVGSFREWLGLCCGSLPDVDTLWAVISPSLPSQQFSHVPGNFWGSLIFLCDVMPCTIVLFNIVLTMSGVSSQRLLNKETGANSTLDGSSVEGQLIAETLQPRTRTWNFTSATLWKMIGCYCTFGLRSFSQKLVAHISWTCLEDFSGRRHVDRVLVTNLFTMFIEDNSSLHVCTTILEYFFLKIFI